MNLPLVLEGLMIAAGVMIGAYLLYRIGRWLWFWFWRTLFSGLGDTDNWPF